jgi:hypothetical protein
MSAFEIVISAILIGGILFLILFVLFQWKDFLRRLKMGWGYDPGSQFVIPILSIPIWGPFYLADRFFHLGIWPENNKK